MALNDWTNPNSTVKQLFSSLAYSELTDRAKSLTISDLMRLAYFSRPGDPPPNEDPTLKSITLDDMKSVSMALEIHIKEKGNDQGWKYTGTVFACTMCTFCAAALSPKVDPKQNNPYRLQT